MSRCSGHCCKDFYLSAESVARLRESPGTFQDGQMIVDMLLPGSSEDRWMCKNLLPNGDCGVYVDRPRMCREYPYGMQCERKGCTLS